MKKFLLSLALFSMILFICYVCSVTFLAQFMDDYIPNIVNTRGKSYSHIRYEDADYYGQVEIVFIGSSHIYRGIDPRIFEEKGYTVYNLGSSIQSPIQSYFILKRYIDLLKPEIVVMDTYPFIFATSGKESTLDLIYNDLLSWDTVQLVIDNFSIQSVNSFFAALGYHILKKPPQGPGPQRKGEQYIFGGYVEKHIETSIPKHYPRMRNITFSPVQKKRFEQCAELLKEKDIEFILIQTPMYSKFNDTLTNAEELDAYFSSFGEFYNFNELQYGLYDNYFYDFHHMNSEGVSIFNSSLIKIFEDRNK